MYQLEFTRDDVQTVLFVGHRYGWSNALLPHLPNFEHDENSRTMSVTESEAWIICDAFNQDSEGGHMMFPMLAECPFKERLIEFYNSVV